MSLRGTVAQALSAVSTATLKHVFRRPAGNFPGKIALYADPHIIAQQATKLSQGSISVVGTNGKTTVTNLIADCLEAQGLRVVCNRGGANLDSGVATSLLQADLSDWGVFETDELWLAKTLPQLQSRYVVLLNLFRDQLDRVGETERIQESIAGALESSPDTVLIYNADDPFCEAIARRVSNQKVPFGMGEDLGTNETGANDAAMCQFCEGMLEYDYRIYNQLGRFHCPNCDFARSPLRFSARNCSVRADGMDFDIMASVDSEGVAGGTLAHIQADYTGVYMVYNLLAIYTTAHLAGVNDAVIQKALAAYKPSNGRLQRLEVQGKQALLNLAKNPTGFNQNIDLIAKDDTPKVVAFFVNDYEGDGRDVSWLWDVDFETLAQHAQGTETKVFAGGLRRNDLQLRLKYAGIPAELIDDAPDCMNRIQDLDNNTHVYMIANYTSLPDVRESMEKLAKAGGTISAPPLRRSEVIIPQAADLADFNAADVVPADQPLCLVQVLPDILNLNGDGGNARIVQQRCAWRGIPTILEQTHLNTALDLTQADIVFVGSGPEREQKLATQYLADAHEALQAYVEDDGVLLAIGGGFQMLGRTWAATDEEVAGAGVVDMQTTQAPDQQRIVGDIVIETPLASHPVVGYENHVGTTTLAEGVQAFGTIIDKHGTGNNGTDNTDGARVHNLIGSFAHGPILAKNPALADWLIQQAIQRRTGQPCELPAIDDSIEQAANQFMCDRLGVR